MDVQEGFEKYEVGPGFRTGNDDFLVNIIRFVKGKIARRLHQFTDGTQVQRCKPSEFVRSFPCNFHGLRRHLGGRIVGFLEFQTVAAEGVARYEIAAGLKILPVDILEDLRLGKTEKLRQFSGF